uniref:Flavodoxin-like domain-containing protein n=1 Tax=Glossina palpalis gambiensis TaxID=67801 RepID=A0A1B0BD66_9MUSC
MRILILDGSQTGTAQDVAEQLWRDSKKRNFDGLVMAMDDYQIQQFTEEYLVLFVVTTTGDGKEPDNMRNTWKFLLRRNLPVDSLSNLQFACLGLGDSSYAKFNYAAKKLNKRLQQLGAQPIVPLALADDQHDYGSNAVVIPWMTNVWEEWHCCKLEHTAILDEDNYHLLWPHRQTPTHSFKLINNVRTTDPSHFQDVRFIQFEVPESATWLPGDIIEIHPHNSKKQIDEFFALVQEHELNFDSNTLVRMSSNHQGMILPKCYSKPLNIGDNILGCLKRGTMQLSKELSTPLIMIGPGTGIAPFRSIIQKLTINQNDLNSHKSLMWIFFGCRNRSKDFHFQNDLELWHKQNHIKLVVAFSRDQDHKIYVQHLIEENSQELKKLIKECNAYVYVAGSSTNMPKAVKEAFINVLDKDEAYVEKMFKINRYQEETWS